MSFSFSKYTKDVGYCRKLYRERENVSGAQRARVRGQISFRKLLMFTALLALIKTNAETEMINEK